MPYPVVVSSHDIVFSVRLKGVGDKRSRVLLDKGGIVLCTEHEVDIPSARLPQAGVLVDDRVSIDVESQTEIAVPIRIPLCNLVVIEN